MRMLFGRKRTKKKKERNVGRENWVGLREKGEEQLLDLNLL